MEFQLYFIHFRVITEFTILLLDMNDGAYRKYLYLCNRTADLNANFTNHSNTIQNLIFPTPPNSISIWDSPLFAREIRL